MSTLGERDQLSRGAAQPLDDEEQSDWVQALRDPGVSQLLAMRRLHELMLRAAGHQVWRMRAFLPDGSSSTVDEIVNQAADEAMTALLGKLDTFQGRSRFTTWAYKFAILQAATEVRRRHWQHREVQLRDLDLPADRSSSPDQEAEAFDLAGAVARAMHQALTPYQRRIAVALMVDEVPIDVLADRLGSSRGALYKTLHDARVRLRAHLRAAGYLESGNGSLTAAATDQQRAVTTPGGNS